MGNVEIYRKTLRFSVMRLLVTILGIFINRGAAARRPSSSRRA